MSFFSDFSGDKKVTQPQLLQSGKVQIEDQRIKFEKVIEDLQSKIIVLEQKQNTFGPRIDQLKAKVKWLFSAGMKKEANEYIEEAMGLQKQQQSYTQRKKVLIDKKCQLELAMMDMETIQALDSISEYLKSEQNNQKPMKNGIQTKLDFQSQNMYMPKDLNDQDNGIVKIEKAIEELQSKIIAFEQKQKTIFSKVDQLKGKAKELIEAGMKKEAKECINKVVYLQKQQQSYTQQKKVLIDKKYQLEQAMMDMETIQVLDSLQ